MWRLVFTSVGEGGLKEPKMDMKIYHGKRIAVVIRRTGGHQVFLCTAAFEHDEDLGPTLRIPLENAGTPVRGCPVFVLRNDSSCECLAEDDQYGCDFRIDLAVENRSSRCI
jgi:hypothetical protein